MVFLAFAYSHIRSTSSRWVSHLQNNSCKTPGPVLFSTSVFLTQSIEGKFRTHFGHGSAALTKIHERTGPTVLNRGHHQLRGAGSNGPAPWRHRKMQKTRSHIESLFEVRNSCCRRKKKKRGKDFPLLYFALFSSLILCFVHLESNSPNTSSSPCPTMPPKSKSIKRESNDASSHAPIPDVATLYEMLQTMQREQLGLVESVKQL